MEEEVFTFSFKEVPYIGLDLVSCHTSYKEGLEMLYFTKEKEKMHSVKQSVIIDNLLFPYSLQLSVSLN